MSALIDSCSKTLLISVGDTVISNLCGVGKKGAKLERKFADHKNLHHYFGIRAI